MKILAGIVLLCVSHAACALVLVSPLPNGYVWDTVAVDGLVYVDRNYTFVAVPAAFDGVDFLKTANSDKKSTTGFSFDVVEPVKVTVGYDDRFSGTPTWLAGWTVESSTVTLTNSKSSVTTLKLYSNDFTEGNITLGGYEGGSPNMYSVFLVPTAAEPPVLTREVTLTWDQQGFPANATSAGFKAFVRNNFSGSAATQIGDVSIPTYSFQSPYGSFCFSISAYAVVDGVTRESVRSNEACAVVDGADPNVPIFLGITPNHPANGYTIFH